MKIDFTKVVLRDIAGKPIKTQKDVHKTIANTIYFGVQSIDLLDIASMINKGQTVELLPSQVREVKMVLLSKNSRLAGFAKKAVGEYLDKRLATNPEKKSKSKKKR